MGKDTEMREATNELGADLAEAKDSTGAIKALTSYLWKNVFPIMILGLFGLGTSNHLGMSGDVSNAHERVSDVQYEHTYRMTAIEANSDYRIQWTQEALASLAAESAAARKLLEEAQVTMGIMQFRIERLEAERQTQGPVFGPAPEDPASGGPGQKPMDYEGLMKRLSKELGKRPKVEPHDIDRYLNEQRPIQAPPMQRPIKNAYKK